MNKNNTVLISIDTEQDLSKARSVEVVFMQKEKPILNKSGGDVSINDGTVEVILSAEETGLFEAGRYVPVQINAYYEEGSVVSSNIMYRPFNGTTKGAK